jgi:hypothetical protein
MYSTSIIIPLDTKIGHKYIYTTYTKYVEYRLSVNNHKHGDNTKFF